MPRWRLGVALMLPADVAAEVDGLRRACGDGTLARVPPHLTLVPPVNVRLEDVSDALAVMRDAAAATRRFELALGPVDTFHPDTPVVYLTVGGDLDALRNLRDRVFTPPLARPLTWPFVPHVTLADEMAPDRIEAVVAGLSDYRADVVIDRVVLLREGPGRVWDVIADAAFRRPVVVARGGLPVELWVSTMGDPEVDELLGAASEPPPPGADGFAVAARRDGLLLGGARGWRRGGEVRLERLAVAAEAGLEDIERHLRRVALDLDG